MGEGDSASRFRIGGLPGKATEGECLAEATRRANGEGTKIAVRKDGRFFKAITLSTGKRKFIYGKTKKEVLEKERAVLKEVEDGVVGDPVLLGEFLTRWLRDSVRGTVRVSSYERYERIVRVHIAPALGGTKIKDLSPLDIQNLYRRKLDEGLSPRTVRYIHVTLGRALKLAMKWGYAARNATQAVDPPRQVGKEIFPLSTEQAGALLASVTTDQERALYGIAVTTGMRQVEILGLKAKDLDLKKGVVRVRRTLSLTKEGFSFNPPKTANGKRSIRLVSYTAGALEHHLENRRREDPGFAEESLVFVTEAGTPLRANNLVRRSFKPLLKRAGLPETTRFQDLRHTFATILFQKDVHPKVVQGLLGHGSITLTLQTYTHFIPSLQEGAMDALEDVFGPPEPDNDSDNVPGFPPTGFEPVPPPDRANVLVESVPKGQRWIF